MKFENHTTYRTDDLIGFVVAAHRATDTPMPDYKQVEIRWARRNRHSGWAAYNNGSMCLRLPKVGLDMLRFTRVTEHELAHNRGVHHADMAGKSVV